MGLLDERLTYKPFAYPWCYEAWLTQQKIHWLPEEVPLADDVQDWQKKLTPAEKNLLTQIFRFFTQGDVEVNNCYHRIYLSRFKPTEVVMMLTAFSNMETVHVAAYSHLLDTIGMPEAEYEAFLKYREMKEKWDYMQGFNADTDYNLALSMAAFGAFMEGLQLFASFAILMNFPRYNKMKGMGQIVSWSVRDETLHCESIIKLFKTFIGEKPHLDTPELRARIAQIARDTVEHEDAFIDLAFEQGAVEGLSADEVKAYIRYIADRRLIQLGQSPIFGVKKNPLLWLDDMLNAVEHANFFEQRATEYSKASTQGTWEDVFAEAAPVEKVFTVYSKKGCPHCDMAINMLKSRKLPYEVIKLDDDEERAKFYQTLSEKTGQVFRTVPQIFHGADHVGDSKALMAYLRQLPK